MTLLIICPRHNISWDMDMDPPQCDCDSEELDLVVDEEGGDTLSMCPHCGDDVPVHNGLTAYHDWPKPTRQVCPGSKQNPRCAESDGRPLWNGQSNLRYYRNVT